MKTRKLTQTAMIAGLYAAITFAVSFIAFGAIQYRVSEALTILPVFTPTAIPGLTLGCAIANLIGYFMGLNPAGLIDALFGSAATLIAGLLTYYIGKSPKKWVQYCLAPLPPVLINALVIGFEISYLFTGMDFLLLNMVSVGIGQAVICYGLGVPLMIVLKKGDLYKKIFK